MSIYYQDDHVTLHHGDCLEVMAGMADESVAAVLTDPPYTERTHAGARTNSSSAPAGGRAAANVTPDVGQLGRLVRPARTASAIDAVAEGTGAGRGFCSGANLSGRGAAPANPDPEGPDAGAALETVYNPFVTSIRDYPIPIVTAPRTPK